MASPRNIRFTRLSDQDREKIASLLPLAEGDRMELRVRHSDGRGQSELLPPAAAGAIETLLSLLAGGQRVAVLAEDQELSPSQASAVLGISRALVVLRMDSGDLPFRRVGKHRRALLKDVLALKMRLDIQRKALEALAEDAEDLITNHGL
ncbi:DNA-binding protein [Starkeya sp. 3C]|uniref:DNA-binding protein n=1 Tax=Ancylobacter moscoviensis TaxID=2597768 RepID=A0ABY3DMZ2_9HYPH|nr:DNA-binding protein [Ancylobacter moscoviensis]TSJ60815.1 DNA-binding protein [Ancylobacter moscoviensis]